MSNISRVVPEPRLRRYREIAGPDDQDVEVFYVWAQSLAMAVFADIAATEVLVRSAIASELNRNFGSEWYKRADLFDDETARLVATAWGSAKLRKLDENPAIGQPTVEGKLVATLMFGFWTRLLGRGGDVGSGPARKKRGYHELLWEPALQRAFPGVSRRDVLTAAERIRHVRNRVAHHEHIAWGVVIPGEKDATNGPLVLSVADVHREILQLANYVDAAAALWISSNSKVTQIVSACPPTYTSMLRLS